LLVPLFCNKRMVCATVLVNTSRAIGVCFAISRLVRRPPHISRRRDSTGKKSVTSTRRHDCCLQCITTASFTTWTTASVHVATFNTPFP
jgi:hypothetical protein